MTVVMFTNLKGRVAKTTNAVAIAECLASQGKKTLLIDIDHQCTASELTLGEKLTLDLDGKRRTVHDLLAAMMKPDFSSRQFEAFVRQGGSNIRGGIEDLFVIPCSVRIDDFQTNWAKGGHGFQTWDDFRNLFRSNQSRFRKWLDKNFEVVVVDCPPSLAIQVKLILKVADAFIVPCQPNRLSIRGALTLHERILALGYRKRCLGILWSMVRGNDRLHKETMAKAADTVLANVCRPFATHIPLSANISHATDQVERAPKSFRGKYGTEFGKIYEELCEEILERLVDESNPASSKRKITYEQFR